MSEHERTAATKTSSAAHLGKAEKGKKPFRFSPSRKENKKYNINKIDKGWIESALNVIPHLSGLHNTDRRQKLAEAILKRRHELEKERGKGNGFKDLSELNGIEGVNKNTFLWLSLLFTVSEEGKVAGALNIPSHIATAAETESIAFDDILAELLRRADREVNRWQWETVRRLTGWGAVVAVVTLVIAGGISLISNLAYKEGPSKYPEWPQGATVPNVQWIDRGVLLHIIGEDNVGYFGMSGWTKEYLLHISGHEASSFDPLFLKSGGRRIIMLELSGSLNPTELLYNSVLTDMDKDGIMRGPAGGVREINDSKPTDETLRIRGTLGVVRKNDVLSLNHTLNSLVEDIDFDEDLFKREGNKLIAKRTQRRDEITTVDWIIRRHADNNKLIFTPSPIDRRQLDTLPKVFTELLDKARGGTESEAERSLPEGDEDKLGMIAYVLGIYFEWARVPFARRPGETWGEAASRKLEIDGKIISDCDVLTTYVYLFARYLGMENVAIAIGLVNTNDDDYIGFGERHAIVLVKATIKGKTKWRALDPSGPEWVDLADIEWERLIRASELLGEADRPDTKKRGRLVKDSKFEAEEVNPTDIGRTFVKPIEPEQDRPEKPKSKPATTEKVLGLIKTLDNKDYFKRKYEELEAIGEPACMPLIEALSYLNPDGRQAALHILTQIKGFKDPRAINPVMELLGDEDYNVRDSAIEFLSRYGEAIYERVYQIVKNGTKGKNQLMKRKSAILLLPKLKDPRQDRRTINILISALGVYEIGQVAEDALVKIGEPAVLPLISVLDDEGILLVYRAGVTLGKIGDTRAIGPLLSRIGRKSTEDYAIALGSFGEKATGLLLAIAIDPKENESRRAAAIEALGCGEDKKAVGPLTALFKENMPAEAGTAEVSSLWYECVRSLSKLDGDNMDRLFLETLRNHKNPKVKVKVGYYVKDSVLMDEFRSNTDLDVRIACLACISSNWYDDKVFKFKLNVLESEETQPQVRLELAHLIVYDYPGIYASRVLYDEDKKKQDRLKVAFQNAIDLKNISGGEREALRKYFEEFKESIEERAKKRRGLGEEKKEEIITPPISPADIPAPMSGNLRPNAAETSVLRPRAAGGNSAYEVGWGLRPRAADEREEDEQVRFAPYSTPVRLNMHNLADGWDLKIVYVLDKSGPPRKIWGQDHSPRRDVVERMEAVLEKLREAAVAKDRTIEKGIRYLQGINIQVVKKDPDHSPALFLDFTANKYLYADYDPQQQMLTLREDAFWELPPEDLAALFISVLVIYELINNSAVYERDYVRSNPEERYLALRYHLTQEMLKNTIRLFPSDKYGLSPFLSTIDALLDCPYAKELDRMSNLPDRIFINPAEDPTKEFNITQGKAPGRLYLVPSFLRGASEDDLKTCIESISWQKEPAYRDVAGRSHRIPLGRLIRLRCGDEDVDTFLRVKSNVYTDELGEPCPPKMTQYIGRGAPLFFCDTDKYGRFVIAWQDVLGPLGTSDKQSADHEAEMSRKFWRKGLLVAYPGGFMHRDTPAYMYQGESTAAIMQAMPVAARERLSITINTIVTRINAFIFEKNDKKAREEMKRLIEIVKRFAMHVSEIHFQGFIVGSCSIDNFSLLDKEKYLFMTHDLDAAREKAGMSLEEALNSQLVDIGTAFTSILQALELSGAEMEDLNRLCRTMSEPPIGKAFLKEYLRNYLFLTGYKRPVIPLRKIELEYFKNPMFINNLLIEEASQIPITWIKGDLLVDMIKGFLVKEGLRSLGITEEALKKAPPNPIAKLIPVEVAIAKLRSMLTTREVFTEKVNEFGKDMEPEKVSVREALRQVRAGTLIAFLDGTETLFTPSGSPAHRELLGGSAISDLEELSNGSDKAVLSSVLRPQPAGEE